MDGELLSEAFVELTDTMVAGFDVIDFLHVLTDRSVQLLDVSAAGLLLADPRSELRVVAASSEPDIRVGQALADVATISLLHERSMRHSDTLNEQLQTALNSRVIIEQAKGKLAERLGVDMDRAFTLLRDRARTSNRRLSDLAQAFIDGTETLTSPAASRSGQQLPGDGKPRQYPRQGSQP